MRVRKHSRSGLFLIELMIAIAFFALTTAVFVQAFVKSHEVSRQAEELFQAQKLSSSVAEILGGAGQADGNETAGQTDGNELAGQEDNHGTAAASSREKQREGNGKIFLQELQKYFPELESSENGAYIYYDGDWKACKESGGVYVLAVAWQRDGQMWDVSVTVWKREENAKSGGEDEQTEIYQLALKIYYSDVKNPDAGGEPT